MAKKWNEQEQGAKRRRSNQGTRGTTQPAASNPNKNRRSTDTNRNSGRTAAAKPAPKAAPKQTKPKTVYYSNKNKGSKGVAAGVKAATRAATNTATKKAEAKYPQTKAFRTLSRQAGARNYVTGRDIPLAMNRPKTFQQTVTPLEQMKADAVAGPKYWGSRAVVPSKKLTAEQQKKKNQQTAKQSGFNARARKQTLSSYDQKLSQGKQFQIQQAKQRYDEAKAKGDRAGMEKAHREAENLRYTAGYSGGATGNERIAPKLSQDDYNRLNASGRLAMTQAQMTRDRAVTEDEIARADRRIEEILNAPGYRNNRLSEAETGKGWTYGPDGRRMWAGTKEQNRADAAPGLAALRAVGEGAVGGLLYAGQTASRATRDKFERENIDKWIADEANYNQAKSDLEFIRSYKEQFGVVPEGYNEMQAQIAYNNAVQARAQLQRIRGDVDSLYFDPTVAERLGLSTTREETLGERLLRQAAEDQAKATEGMNGVERFVTNALISTGQSVPGMALGLIPGVGPALGLGVLGAQAGGSRAYDLRQQGVTAEDAYRAGFISGGIEALTEKLPLENFAQIVKGKGGKSALRNVLEQAGLEGSEEAVSYVGNYIADVAQQNPDAHFSWLELLENAGMGAIGGAAFGVAGGILSPGHAVSPAGAQSEEIQEHARGAAAQVEAVQDAETQLRTVAAQRLREDAQAYNEMVKAGVWSDAEKEMVKASLDQRYAEIAGQNAGQTSPVANQAPLTQAFEDGMQRNRGRAERAPAASVPTPLAANEKPVSVNPVEQAERMTAEALRATGAEMARRDAVAQLQAETPPITYERSGLPPTSFLGAAIDARREARARAEAEAQVRRDQEIARQNRVEAEQRSFVPNAAAQHENVSVSYQNQQAQQPVSRLESLASTFGESGAASLRTIGGKMLTGQGAFVRDFTDVYNQVLGGRSESQVNRPAGMSDANYFAAVTAAQNDRQTGWDLDILKASKAAGRNVNAGVDWRDQYVRQMDRKTARTADGLAKALGVKVVFAEKGSILTAGGTAANAEITGNVVRIEKDNPNPVRMLIGHELTHRMQDVSPESYRAFRDYAMSVPGSMEALERTVSLYQRAGAFRAQDNARQMAMDEVTADFAGSLLENSDQLQEFIRRNYENRTMLEVIRDFFRDLAAKLTGRERAQADEAVRLLEEAIKGASAQVKETGKAEKGNKNTAREGGVKKLFSLSAPVEETDRFIASHNLNAEKMRGALELGGLAMPSVAMTPANIAHTGYGDITVVFGKDSVNPKDKRNQIFSDDAYTPTVPAAGYKISSDVTKRLRERIDALLDGLPSDLRSKVALDTDNIRDNIQRWGEDFGKVYGDNIALKTAYLIDQGETIKVPMRYAATRSGMDKATIRKAIRMFGDMDKLNTSEKLDAFIEPARELERQYYREKFSKKPELADTLVENFGWSDVDKLRNDAQYLKRHGDLRKITDLDALEKTVSRKLGTKKKQAAFEDWLRRESEGIIEKKGIRNDKDIFTRTGNRRSFEQLYDDYNLANIVKAMQQDVKQGKVGFLTGSGNIRGAAAKTYGSIEDARKEIGRIRETGKDEDFTAQYKAFDQRCRDLCAEMTDGTRLKAWDAAEVLTETLAKHKTEPAIYRYLMKEWGSDGYLNITPEIAQEAAELIKEAQKLPIHYMEAKLYRAVDLTEPLAYVVPSDLDKDLKQQMKDAGLPMKTYKAGDREDRLNKVNAVKGARFSITHQADADYMAAVERGDMETAQRMVDEAAKAAGYTIKAYHGTPKRFNEFSKYRIGSTTDYGWFGRGFYFTTEKDVADVYAGYLPDSNVIEAYLNVQNPFVFTEYPGGEDMSPGEIMEDVLGTKYGRRGELTEDDKAQRSEDFTEWLAANGYDGVEIWSQIMILESEQAKRTDPVTYDDNGDVIPLSKRFNVETGDIRYSLGTEGYDRARLMRENQQLKEKLDYWRGQVKKSDRTKADPKEVRKLAKSLRTDYSTEMDAGEITQRLQAIYDGIGKDWTYDRAYEEAGKLARDMIEQATATEDYLYAEYAPMREFFRDTPLVVTKEMQRAIPDYNEWRKPLFGKLRLKGGEQTNVDQVFQEAVERWPEWFSEEVSANSLDQLERIAEVMGGIYSRDEVNPFGDDIAGPAGYLTTQIMDSFWDVPSIKKTFADRAEARLGREVTRRLDMKERYENALQKVREQRDRKLREQSQKYLAAKKENSQKQKERELRAKIVRHCGRLSAKLKSGTDKQHVPEVMQRIVATALDSINLGSGFTLVYDENGKAKRVKDGSGETTKRTEAFEELRKFYQQIITADPDEALAGEMPEIISKIVVSEELPRMIDGIIGFRDTPIANLGKADLDKIWETVKAIETTISTYDKALGQARFETISEPAFAIQDYAAPKKDRRNYAGGMKHVDRLLNVGMLKPIYFLYRLGDGGKMIWKMIEDAQSMNIRYLDEIRAYQEEHFKPGTAKRLEKQKHTFNFDGQKIELTTAQLINLYNLRKREQAEGHILEGGFRPDQIVKGIRDVTPAAPWHFTAEQIGEMLNVVARDAELVRIADAMMDGIKPQAVHGNAASMEVYGIKKYRERNYWPIESDENQTQTDIKNEAVSKTVAGSGFAKATQKGANNAIILRSAFDVYDDHVVGMAKYAAWLGPIENLRRILNFRYKDETGHMGGGVKEMLTKIIGKDGPGYYKKLMDDLNAGIKATSDNPFQQFIGSYKAAAIAGNIRVVAQQPTSIMRALAEVDPQDFLLGMAEARPGQWENEIKKYAPIAIWKDWGYFTADTGRQMRNIFWGDDNVLQTANNIIMNNRFFSPGAADAVTWTAIWNAVKRETKRTRKDLNPDAEEFMYAVRDRFNEVINLTQVVDGIPQRSQLMRSENDVTKMATSFMGEPTTTYNMATFALHKARTSTGAERGKAMRHLARTTVALATSIALNAAAQSLVDAMRDDDKDEGYWEKFFQAFFGLEGETRKDRIKSAILNGNLGAGMNPLTYIPFIKDVVSKRQGYKVTRMDMDIISRVMDSYDAVVKAMNGEGKKTRKNAWINFIAECSRFLGVPVANIKRDILSGVSTVFQVTGNYRLQYELEKFLYNIEGTGNFSEFAKLAYLAKRDGDTEAYEAIRADLIANGPKTEKDVDKKIAEFEKKAVTDTEEYQTALAQKTDAYNTMLEASDQFQALTEDQQTKARGMVEDYAEWQAYGDQVALGEKDQAAYDKIREAEAHDIPATDWIVFTTAASDLKADYKEDGTRIDGSKKEKVLKLIDSYDIPNEGKSYMYLSQGYSEKDNPYQ